MSKAFVTFLSTNGSRGEWFRIRFNTLAAKPLNGITNVEIGKNSNHIVIIPVSQKTNKSIGVGRDGQGVPYLSLNRLVKNHGFLSPDLFDGTRYAVKRNKDGTKMYICLDETVEDERGVTRIKKENAKLKSVFSKYVVDYKVCRFCAHKNEDCTPTGIECAPEWEGV